jgi:hypothetical protein
VLPSRVSLRFGDRVTVMFSIVAGLVWGNSSATEKPSTLSPILLQ